MRRNHTLLKCATWTMISSSAKSSSSFGISSMRYSLVGALLIHSSCASSFCMLNILFEIISTSLHSHQSQHTRLNSLLWRASKLLCTCHSVTFHITQPRTLSLYRQYWNVQQQSTNLRRPEPISGDVVTCFLASSNKSRTQPLLFGYRTSSFC